MTNAYRKLTNSTSYAAVTYLIVYVVTQQSLQLREAYTLLMIRFPSYVLLFIKSLYLQTVLISHF